VDVTLRYGRTETTTLAISQRPGWLPLPMHSLDALQDGDAFRRFAELCELLAETHHGTLPAVLREWADRLEADRDAT
jgi:hypothetical protein